MRNSQIAVDFDRFRVARRRWFKKLALYLHNSHEGLAIKQDLYIEVIQVKMMVVSA